MRLARTTGPWCFYTPYAGYCARRLKSRVACKAAHITVACEAAPPIRWLSCEACYFAPRLPGTGQASPLCSLSIFGPSLPPARALSRCPGFSSNLIRLLKKSYIRRRSDRLSEAKNSRTMPMSSGSFTACGIVSLRHNKRVACSLALSARTLLHASIQSSPSRRIQGAVRLPLMLTTDRNSFLWKNKTQSGLDCPDSGAFF